MGSERGGGRWATSGMAAAGRRAEQEAAGHAIDGTCSWEEDLVAEKIQLNYGGDAAHLEMLFFEESGRLQLCLYQS
jgi:hypothetical protein